MNNSEFMNYEFESNMTVDAVVEKAKKSHWKAVREGNLVHLSRKYKSGKIEMTLKKEKDCWTHD